MATIIVTRPELTAAERAKRMEEIKQAAVRLVLETEKAKRRKAQRNKYIGGTT
jgi:hypothetical protein